MKNSFRAVDSTFIIDNYNSIQPFSSFFPALAGETGRPMWLFYTNRAQGVASFGVNNKDGAMMEFLPANKAYQATASVGFRTFIRAAGERDWIEPFALHQGHAHQEMRIRAQELELFERDTTHGLETTILYFGVPNESLPVLARKVEFKNISNKKLTLDVIDGMPRIVPYGMNDYLVKHMSRTIEAFAEVKNRESNVPFYKLRIEPSDRPELVWLDAGFFSFGLADNKLMPVVVDPTHIFGTDTAFLRPIQELPKDSQLFGNQLLSNTMPSSLFRTTLTLKPHESASFVFYYGYAENSDLSQIFSQHVLNTPDYFSEKREEMKSVLNNLTKRFSFTTANDNLNNYSTMSFMDNVLRGGYPLVMGEQGPIVHIFSRKHGDMERDYNSFQVSSNYYSQGNGNFRDVNQNRRHDLYLDSKVGTANVDFFFNHLQLDGYNPLVINPVRFQVLKNLLSRMSFKSSDEFLRASHALTRQPVLAGEIYAFVKQFSADPLNVNALFKEIMLNSAASSALKHEEGFWVDHWIYNLDHLEQYLLLFPEKKMWLLYDKNDFTFFDSDHFVQPRKDKYVLTMQGQLRQYNAVIERKDKKDLIASRPFEKNKVRVDGGQGAVFQTTLFVKLLSLAAVKFSTLDPYGVGLEMEANKPGWCDALNGAPGLFGSSTHEMFELKRLIQFILDSAIPLAPNKSIEVPHELLVFIKEIDRAVALDTTKDFRPVWDHLSIAREDFRARTFMGVLGKTRPHRIMEIKRSLEKMMNVLQRSAEKAIDPKTQLPTSYFVYEVDIQHLPDGWRSLMVKLDWKQKRLPPFLEGAVHAMKVSSPSKNKSIYKNLRKSPLYDKKLGMYKLNAPLTEESAEIGRIKIFTPGWLENESIFLHMHYKYLLEVLRNGFVDEFFEEMKTGLIPFRSPETYGRSIFENSSFICSSSFPNSEYHGRGFVARLSGATIEFMSMVYTLFLGARPFKEVEGGVVFAPQPALLGSWFTPANSETKTPNSISLTVFGVPVTYINASKKNTFGKKSIKPTAFEWILDGRFHQFDGPELTKEASLAFREGRLESLTIFLGKN